jgi:hypothetical protein
MAKRGQRDPERERFWRGTLSAWRTSGLSVREFCDRRDLTQAAFYYFDCLNCYFCRDLTGGNNLRFL